MQSHALPPIRLPQAKNDLNLRLICKFCRDKVPNLIEDWKTGDMVCGNCGLVIGPRIIDTSSEWRTFANSDEADGDPSRVGSVRDSLLGPGLDSLMIGTSKTGLGKDLQKTNNKIAHDRNVQTLLTAFKDIQHLTDLISLPRVVTDTIKRYYKKVDFC